MRYGENAACDARRQWGLEEVSDPESYYVLPVGVYENEIYEQKHGTVGAVALDRSGSMAAATSTGGTFGKLEGRVGDSPMIGAGIDCLQDEGRHEARCGHRRNARRSEAT